MLTAILGFAAGMITTVCSTARDMYKDNLISKKELAEIEAKSKAFKEIMGLKKHTLGCAFKLEMRWLDHKDKLLDNITALLDKFDKSRNERHLEFYAGRIKQMQDTYSLLLTEDPKYFHDRLLEQNGHELIEFHNDTQIGSGTTKYEAPMIEFVGKKIQGNNKSADKLH